MPVTGLPIAAETSLNALLSGHAVSSWKIVGEGDSTVVVFRLKLNSELTTTNMAAPMPPVRAHYRRKPPSQLRRDQERAATRQQQHHIPEYQASDIVDNNCAGDTPLFLPSWESDIVDIPQHEKRPTLEVHTTADVERTGFMHDQDNLQHTGSGGDNFSVLPCGGAVGYTASGFSSPPADSLQLQDSSIINARAAGFNVVKDYVSTLTNRQTQRRLRNTTQNVSFNKIVLCERGSRECFLFESDDLILEYDTMGEDLRFWFAKQDARSMSAEENGKLNELRRGRHIGTSVSSQLRARAEQHLGILADLMRYYLG